MRKIIPQGILILKSEEQVRVFIYYNLYHLLNAFLSLQVTS